MPPYEMKWAVFLDRDGTINEEVEYLSDPSDLCLIRGAAEAIRLLNDAGIPTIVVTNQAGVGRGYFPEGRVVAVHEKLTEQLTAHGARLDAFYYCPHHPDDGCACRKPQPGMLEQAAREQRLDLRRSFVVGDKVSDLEAGRRANCRTVLVLTGYGAQAQVTFRGSDFQPDHIARDLLDAVRWILDREGPAP